jgi:hypothetical protein
MTVSESAEIKKREKIANDCFVMKNVFQIRVLSPNCVNAISEDLLPVLFQCGLINTLLLNALSQNMPP